MICIKISFKKWNKPCEMWTKAHISICSEITCIYEWYKHFQDDRENVESNERSRKSRINEENVAFWRKTVSNGSCSGVIKWSQCWLRYAQKGEETEKDSNDKVILTVFFNFNGIVYHKFLLEDETINQYKFNAVCLKRSKNNATQFMASAHPLYCISVNFWLKTTP